MSAEQTEVSPDDWAVLLRDCVVYGLLFRAAMADLAALRGARLKLPYEPVLEELSRWAERRHHRLRRALSERGCRLLTSGTEGHMYCVRVRVRGYVREAVYSVELLRAECAGRIRQWAMQQGGDNH